MLQLEPFTRPVAEATPARVGRPCGWFDSSWELQQGLDVIEYNCPDPVARELGLDAWLVMQMLAAKQQRKCAMIW